MAGGGRRSQAGTKTSQRQPIPFRLRSNPLELRYIHTTYSVILCRPTRPLSRRRKSHTILHSPADSLQWPAVPGRGLGVSPGGPTDNRLVEYNRIGLRRHWGTSDNGRSKRWQGSKWDIGPYLRSRGYGRKSWSRHGRRSDGRWCRSRFCLVELRVGLCHNTSSFV